MISQVLSDGDGDFLRRTLDQSGDEGWHAVTVLRSERCDPMRNNDMLYTVLLQREKEGPNV